MKKLIEIRNEADERACDLVEEDDGALRYYMKCSDNKGHSKTVIVNMSDVVYPAIKRMSRQERQRVMRLCSYHS